MIGNARCSNLRRKSECIVSVAVPAEMLSRLDVSNGASGISVGRATATAPSNLTVDASPDSSQWTKKTILGCTRINEIRAGRASEQTGTEMRIHPRGRDLNGAPPIAYFLMSIY